MPLPIDTVTRTLNRLAFSRSARQGRQPPLLIAQRIFPCASDEGISRTVAVLYRYTIGAGLHGKEVEDKRAGDVLRVLFRGDRMDPDNSRTLLHIVEELVVKIGAYRIDLANVILDIVFKQICGSFEHLWDVRIPFIYSLFPPR